MILYCHVHILIGLKEIGALKPSDHPGLPSAHQLGQSGDIQYYTTPMFTDGTFLYFVNEVEGKGKKDAKKYVVEMFDPRQKMSLVRRVELQSIHSLPHDHVCNGCQRVGFVGVRYCCTQCSDFNLCASCHGSHLWSNSSHSSTHRMKEHQHSPKKGICTILYYTIQQLRR